jgi:hypothetical protein
MIARPRLECLVFTFAAFGLLGCGGEDTPPPVEQPDAPAVRTAYGLNPGSCWKYRYTQTGVDLFANVDVAGPNDTAIAGRTVYVRSFRLEAGGLPTEDYFDTESDSKVRLIRHVEGQGTARTTKRYEDNAEPPVFAEYHFNSKKEVIMRQGDKFETLATPKDMAEERHVWSVLSDEEQIVTPDGTKPGYKLQYTRGTSETALYYVVPEFGVANFIDFAGVTHQVCAARVCDASGACTGSDSCSNLVCM